MSAKLPSKDETTPKPGKDTIYVDVDDEITAIIDKVEASKHKIVALVLPKRAATLQSIVNMRLLKRSSESAGKSVVLITNEHALLPLAGASGLHVAKNLQSKPEIPPPPHGEPPESGAGDEIAEEEMPEKLDYSRPVGELAGSKDGEETETIALDDDSKSGAATGAAASGKKASKKGLKVPNFDRFRMGLLLGGAGLAAFIIFLILAIWVLPKATITIATKATPVSANFDLKASGNAKELDEEEKIIPSELKKSNQTASEQVSATGQKNLGEKASGAITMTARKCSGGGNPPSVPAGSGVSANGQTYITQQEANFQFSSLDPPCANFTSNNVNIAAQNPGSKYNVSNATFSVAGRSDVSAQGSASGGTDRNVTVLTQQDVENARQKITSEESDKFSKEFQQDLSDQGYYVLVSTLKISEPKLDASPKVGEEAENSNVQVTITYSVLVVKREDLTKAVETALKEQFDENKQQLSDEDPLANLTINVANQSGANATLEINKETSAIPKIDQNAIKEQAKGKKPSQVKSDIENYPGVERAEVDLSPIWVSSVPKKTGKIKIVLEKIEQDQ